MELIEACDVLFLLEYLNYYLLKLKGSHLKVSIQLLMYTVLKRTIFLTIGIDILYRSMVMQLFRKDKFNNVSVSFK